MHNPRALRVEWNFHQTGSLELWISPGAGESLRMEDRNFSNRDDHTKVFDRITLVGLTEETFLRCDYDPFVCVFYFKGGQVLRAQLMFEEPVLVVWADKPWVADLKGDKQDRALRQDARGFVLEHPDRGRVFRFAAAVSSGGSFRVSSACASVPEGRSRYARAELAAGARLVLGGELAGTGIEDVVARAAKRTPAAIRAAAERRIAEALRAGTFKLKDPRLQQLLDKNRRVLVAMQDLSGAVRAAVNRIYYLLWVRDGGIIAAGQAMAGRSEPLVKWVEFLLANPSRIEGEEPRGRTFGMLCGDLSKWEEDGVFYAVWAVFMAWTQTGDEAYRAPAKLGLLREAIAWLDRHCGDAKRGLFGRYFACEAPFAGSRDDGFDNAVGSVVDRGGPQWKGAAVKRSYDIYINLAQYSVFVMMAALDERRAKAWLGRAEALVKAVEPFMKSPLPDYGLLERHGAKPIVAGPVGLDLTDYVWALSLFPFYPDESAMPAARLALRERALSGIEPWFLAGWFSLLASLDPLWAGEAGTQAAIDQVTPDCYRPGKFLPMADTVVEMTQIQDGDIWHDVRPQAFSVGPWLATMTGLGLRRLPFGLAVRAPQALTELRGYEWRRARIDVAFVGEGEVVEEVTINGKALRGAWQLPEGRLRPGKNRVRVRRGRGELTEPVLAGSTVELLASEAAEGGGWRHRVRAYGANTLMIAGPLREAAVRDARGRALAVTRREAQGLGWLSFAGRGECEVVLR